MGITTLGIFGDALRAVLGTQGEDFTPVVVPRNESLRAAGRRGGGAAGRRGGK
jgi:polyribonucleotide nucleotidyltransferase